MLPVSVAVFFAYTLAPRYRFSLLGMLGGKKVCIRNP